MSLSIRSRNYASVGGIALELVLLVTTLFFDTGLFI